MIRIAAISLVIAIAMFLPYMPGEYDALSVTLSGMTQFFAIGGLVLVPIGAAWLIHDAASRTNRSFAFGILSLVMASLLMLVVAAAAREFVGLSGTVITLLLWAYLASRLARRLRGVERRSVQPAALYLVCLPLFAAALKFTLVDDATDFSRRYAIERSDSLIADIERFRLRRGHYPVSLLSLHQDYDPGIVGIRQFHYEPKGQAYNIFFEQFSDVLGTREIVMYNKLGEHNFYSHDADLLQYPPEVLARSMGYYAVRDGPLPGWKSFLLD